MKSKLDIMLVALGIIFLGSALLAISESLSITGFATTGTTISNVSITKYLSITMSTNLSDGILFGTVSALPATNLNASHNYDSSSSASTMFINVSVDSNTAVNFCVKADANLTDSAGGNTIGLGNESYNNATTTSASLPSVASEISLTSDYVQAGKNVSQGNVTYYRFWLDIPAATPSGNYNNTISFKGVEVTSAC
jgi:hypothetical protein